MCSKSVLKLSMVATHIMIVFGLLAVGATAVAQSKNESNIGGRCSNRTLKGSYGELLNGTILGYGPFTVVGVATFDGDGNWSRVETSNVNGQVFPETLTGTYTVNPDCSGTALMTNGESSAFVIVNEGRKIFAMGTNPIAVLTVVLEK